MAIGTRPRRWEAGTRCRQPVCSSTSNSGIHSESTWGEYPTINPTRDVKKQNQSLGLLVFVFLIRPCYCWGSNRISPFKHLGLSALRQPGVAAVVVGVLVERVGGGLARAYFSGGEVIY